MLADKIRWAPTLKPALLKRLYDSDAAGFRDVELCDEVGIRLYNRCVTFAMVRDGHVSCPVCQTAFVVHREGLSHCPGESCGWPTTWASYAGSLRRYGAHPGRAMSAYEAFLREYPRADTYQRKMLTIDRLIHSFHIHELSGEPVKSVASKLLEGNKKEVVRFLDDLSALHPGDKARWRREMAKTIDRRIVQGDGAPED